MESMMPKGFSSVQQVPASPLKKIRSRLSSDTTPDEDCHDMV